MIARTLSYIKESYSVAFADFVRSRELEGHKIIKMQTGDPDFDTHPSIVKAATSALNKGETKYCDSRGLLPLRKSIAKKLLEKNNISASPKNILVTHGAVHGISIAIRALVNPGDECIILEPYWRAYEANVILAGGVPVILKTSASNGFSLDAEKVLEAVTPKTKLILINTPNNPSGAVYDPSQLKVLATGAAKKGVYILSDEVYETIIYSGSSHYSMASDVSVSNWIITAFSFSKTYAMTGWRVGYIVASEFLIDEMLKLSQFSITSLSPFNQLGALAAIDDNDSQSFALHMREEYESRKTTMEESIKNTWLAKTSTIPKGTFYMLIDFSEFKINSLDLAKTVVEESNVAFTPGIAFGNTMDNYLRMCFATSEQNITSALTALLETEKKLRR